MNNIKRFLAEALTFTFFLTSCTGSGGSGSSSESSSEATLALGQNSASSVNSPLVKGIGCAGKSAVAGTKLFLADICNNRVLIYNALPTQSYQQASLVLGQADFTNGDSNRSLLAPSASSLNRPNAVATDGTHLVVADTENNRVLIWNSIPTTNGQAADVVIGQADFVTMSAQSTSDSTLSGPYGVAISGTKLFVVDTNNNRTLIWNTIPTTNGQAADVVVGQNNFTDNSNSGFSNVPYDVATDGTKLVIAGNQMSPRIWNAIPTTNGVAPDLDLTNSPTLTDSWNGFNAVFIVSGKLIIVGGNGTGTYVWNSIPTAVPDYADYEVGTHDSGSSPSALNMTGSTWATSDGTRLFISDNSRLLIWNSFPLNNSTGADLVLGQPDMTTDRYNFTVTDNKTLKTPTDVTFVGSKLVVSDFDNNRLLIWNSTPTSSNQSADVVVGQTNMTSYGSGTSATTFSGPWTVSTDGTRLFASDFGNHRILIWNTVPTSNGAAANVVVGQADMTSNSTSVSSSTLYLPGDAESNGTILAVADSGNNRVLIWNTVPSTDGVAADIVLGQPDMTSNSSAGGATGMNWPDSVKIIDGKLFVSDSGNCRVLIWNTIPTTDTQPADVVIGQPDMTSTTCGSASASTVSDSRMNYNSTSGRLYISDFNWNRILVFDTIPTTDGVSADSVIGQSSFTTTSCGDTSSSFKNPWGMVIKDGFLWLADMTNNRVLKMNLP